MKSFRKIIISLMLLAVVTASLSACQKETAEEKDESLEIKVAEFSKRGNAILDIDFDTLKQANIEVADIINVVIGDQTYEIPVCTNYSDVDLGSVLCRFDLDDSEVGLAINGGSFAEEKNMAVKENISEDPGYRWDVQIDTVKISLKEKGGYQDEYKIHNLERSNERSDYSELSDADYANCRVVSIGNLKDGVLYRGTTPLDDGIGRSTYAMAFIQENGVKSILNLHNSMAETTAYETYNDSYYASCNIWYAEMDYAFASESFATKVKDCIKFMIENDGPYYVHCKEGKDRTGVFCALLEAYFGASYEEIRDDYMLTYKNFYGVESGNETYDVIIKANLNKILSSMFAVDDIQTTDLKAEAEEYLLASGLTAEDLSALTIKLSK